MFGDMFVGRLVRGAEYIPRGLPALDFTVFFFRL